MPVRKWRSLILAYRGNKVIMISGVHREHPDRLYFPTDVDKAADADSVATACRILRTQTGVNLLPSSVSLSRVTEEKTVPFYIYTAEIEERRLLWFRPQTGTVKASLVDVDTILSTPLMFGNRTRKALFFSNLLKILSPTQMLAVPSTPTSGVCQSSECGKTFVAQHRGDSCTECGSRAAY